MRFLKVLSVLVIVLVLFIAAWQNIPPILEKSITFRLDLYWVRWESAPIPIYLITPLCFFAGLILMGIVDIGTIFKLRRRVKKLEKQLAAISPQELGSAHDRSGEILSDPSSHWGSHTHEDKKDTMS